MAHNRITLNDINTENPLYQRILSDEERRAIDKIPKTHRPKHTNTFVTESMLEGITPGPHALSHQNGGSDEILVTGLSGLLADAQTPKAHASNHQSGGSDPIKLDDLAAPDDTVDLNASNAKHGLLPKLDSNPAHFFDGTGAWATPPGTGAPTTSTFITNTDETGILPNSLQHCNLSGVQLHDPKSHASSHENGGGDAIKLDDLATPDDNTDLNASNTRHGLLLKLDADSAHFLRGDGTWATPPGTGAPTTPTYVTNTDETGDLPNSLQHSSLSGVQLHDPKAHKASHENGGGDELSIAGLSGEAADPQPPKSHGSDHTDGTDAIGVDDSTIEIDIGGGSGLRLKDEGITGAKHSGWGAAAVSTALVKDAGGNLAYQANLIDAGYADSLHKHIGTVYTAVYIVAPTAGEGQYQTITAALSAASGAGHTSTSRGVIWVMPGNYSITSTLSAVQYVDIIGLDRDACRVAVGGSVAAFSTITPASDTLIKNLTFTGRYNSYNDDFLYSAVVKHRVRLQNIKLISYFRGVRIDGGTTGFEMSWVETDDVRYVLLLPSAPQGIIRHCKFVKTAWGTYAISMSGTRATANFHISDCVVMGSFTQGYVFSDCQGGLQINNCLADGCTNGFYSSHVADRVPLLNCSAINCTNDIVTNVALGRIHLASGVYDETKFVDAGTGMPMSMGITGGFFNTATFAFDNARV